MVLRRENSPPDFSRPPPWVPAVLSVTVTLYSSVVPNPSAKMPPPAKTELFPLIVLFLMTSGPPPLVAIPPPAPDPAPVLLPVIRQRSIVRAPSLVIPPPVSPAELLAPTSQSLRFTDAVASTLSPPPALPDSSRPSVIQTLETVRFAPARASRTRNWPDPLISAVPKRAMILTSLVMSRSPLVDESSPVPGIVSSYTPPPTWIVW